MALIVRADRPLKAVSLASLYNVSFQTTVMHPPNSQAAASAPPPAAAHRHGFFAQLDRFWQRVTEGLEISQLWTQFRADARSSYRLYHRDFQARAPQEARKRGFWHTAQEYAWAILEKLTPARRVLLLLGVLLLVFPAGGFSYHGKSGEIEIVELDLRFWGGSLLFVLLMLEVADRVVMKRDLEIARDIQRWLLLSQATPRAWPRHCFRRPPRKYSCRGFL